MEMKDTNFNISPLNSELRDDYSYNCFVCDKSFDDEYLFRIHSVEHTLDSECKEVAQDSSAYFDNWDSLWTTHSHFEEDFEIDIEDNVRSDVPISTTYKKEKYVCTVCCKTFKRRDHLDKHFVLHSGVKPFACIICSKKFARKDRLKEHCAVIHSLNGWTCYFCGQMFAQSCILRKHELIHRGIKPYCCDFCSKQFSRKSDLMRHCMSHTGEKPHLCKVCNKRFSQRRLLNRHSMLHFKSL